jgi:hypothetical protein
MAVPVTFQSRQPLNDHVDISTASWPGPSRLVPAVQVLFATEKTWDARNKSGHDGAELASTIPENVRCAALEFARSCWAMLILAACMAIVFDAPATHAQALLC